MTDLQKESTLKNFIHMPIGADWRKNVSKISFNEDKYGQFCQHIRETGNSENVDDSKSIKEFWTASQTEAVARRSSADVDVGHWESMEGKNNWQKWS